MDALNTLRAILVGCAFVATLLLAFQGQWLPAAVLGAGIVAHFLLWRHLRAERHRTAADATAHPELLER